MKYFLSCTLILTFFLGCSDEPNAPFPDFSKCGCSPFPHDIVCGDDGRTYLDSCFAQCLNVEIVAAGNCPDAFNDPNDTMKWAIEVVCIPVIREDDAMEVRILGDGSVLYQRADSSYFRGTQNLCRCLPPSSLVATPQGDLPLISLKNGDEIFVQDHDGSRRIETVAYTRKVPVPTSHQMIEITLEDGRKVTASPLHPTSDGVPLNTLRKGDCLDYSLIIDVRLIDYDDSFTYDILPTGDTPIYIVDGIPLRSTIQKMPL